MIQLKLKNINATVNQFVTVPILNAENGIQLNKTIKEITNPEKYNTNYSNKFDIIVNEITIAILGYKNIINDSSEFYSAILEDDENEIMYGTIMLTSVKKVINGNDVIEAIFYSEEQGFFKKLKDNNLRDLPIVGGFLTYGSTYSPYSYDSQYTLTSPYYFGVVDNGQIDINSLETGVRGVNHQYKLNEYTTSMKADYSMNDIYPSVKVAYLWDKLHTENGMTWNSDGEFFQTDNWKKLLLSDWSNFKEDKETLETFKSSATFNSTINGEATINSIETINHSVIFTDTVGDFTSIALSPLNNNRNLKTKFKAKIKIKFNDDIPIYTLEEELFDISLRTTLDVKLYMKAYNALTANPGDVLDIDEALFSFREVTTHGNTLGATLDRELEFECELDYNQILKQGGYKLVLDIIPSDYHQDSTTGTVITNLFTVQIEGSIEMEPHEKIAVGRVFNFEHVTPNVKQIDVLKNVADLFNLRFEFDKDVENKINWYTFDEYYIKNSEIKDWTNTVEKTLIKKTLGNKWQANETIFDYIETETKLEKAFNNSSLTNFGAKHILNPGNLIKSVLNYTNKYGIQMIDVIDLIPITCNNNNLEKITSGVIYNDMITKPFFSYINMSTSSTIKTFRKDYLGIYNTFKIPGMSYILNPKLPTNPNGTVVSLENANPQNNVGWRTTDSLHYDIFKSTDFTDVVGVAAEQIIIKKQLSNLEFKNLKLSDIIIYEGTSYRIDSIKNFNENKLTDVTLVKVTFNPYYDGTSYAPAATIVSNEYYNSVGIHTIYLPTYTSPVQSFTITVANLTGNLILTNNTNGNTGKYQYSLDNVVWNTLAIGASVTISTITNGDINIYYKLVNATGTIEPGTQYRAFWEFTSDFANNGLVDTIALWGKVKTTPLIHIGIIDVVAVDNDVNIIGGIERDNITRLNSTLM